MRKLFSSHKSKAARILRWCIVALAVIYILVVITVSVSAAISEGIAFWFPLMAAMLLLWSAPLVVSVGVLIRFAVWQLDLHAGEQPGNGITGRFAAWFSAGTAIAGIVFSVLYGGFSNVKQKDFLLYSELALTNKLQELALWFAFFAVLALIADAFCRFLLKKQPKLPAKLLRTISAGLTVVLCAAILLVPHPSGSYNDGGEDGVGSRIFEAVLYEVIDWNRTHNFDGTPYPETEQQMQVYFFPQNCYDYEAKWELRH